MANEDATASHHRCKWDALLVPLRLANLVVPHPSPMETQQPNEWNNDQAQREVLLAVAAGLAQNDGGPVVGLPGLGVLSAAGALLGLPKPHSTSCAEEADSREGDLPSQEGHPALAVQTAAALHSQQELLQETNALHAPAAIAPQPLPGQYASDPISGGASEVMGEPEHQVGVEAQSPRTSGKASLREGATVCFVSPEGEKLMVVQNGKFWELQPCGEQEAKAAGQDNKVRQYDPKCLFIVRRRDKHVIFQSLGAEGRTLQAVGGNTPHRCSNHNFGAWESWEPRGQGFYNIKWHESELGYEIHEVTCAEAEDIRLIERCLARNTRIVQQQVKATEERFLDADRKLKEAVRVNQRSTALHQREIEELRARHEDERKVKEKLELEALQFATLQKQFEMQITQLTAEKDGMETFHQTTVDSIKRDMQSAHVLDVRKIERSYEVEARTLRKERDAEFRRVQELKEKHEKQLRDETKLREHNSSLKIKRLTEEHKSILKEKDSEIASLVKECFRLNTILQKIRIQMQSAQKAQSDHESWNKRGAQSFVPNHSASSMIRDDQPIFSSCGSQMEYPQAGSPLPGGNIVGHNPSGNYRNARASPPASALSGDWMERVSATSRVQAWMKGQEGAEEILEKRVSSDGSALCGGDYPPRTPKATTNSFMEAEQDVVGPDNSEQREETKRVPEMSKLKGAFGSTLEKSPAKDKWEAAQQLTVTTPSLDRDESDPPRSPIAEEAYAPEAVPQSKQISR